MQGPLGALQQVIARALPAFQIVNSGFPAAASGWPAPLRRRSAVADGVQPLVLGDAVEEFHDLDLLAGRKLFLQRLLDGVGDQRRAHVEIAHEPAQSQLIDQRRDDVGDAGQNQHQGQDEA